VVSQLALVADDDGAVVEYILVEALKAGVEGFLKQGR
jgi:predicted N-acetyltransferase YhbS